MNAPVDIARMLQPRPVPAAMIDALKAHFGDRCSTARAVREQHGRDESPFEVPPPEAVVFAESTADVAAAVALAAQYEVPVIAYGTGSSLEGHLLAVQGGISIDVSRMNQVLRINAEDLTVTVQPGVTRNQLNTAIRHTGLFFPIDPGADASLGGMAATRASGTNAVRYGTMRENVLALEVVTASGEVHPHRHPRQEEQRRLRPHPPDGGQRGHAGHPHRGHRQALPAARIGVGRDLPLPQHRRGGARPPSPSSRWACRSPAASCWTPTRCATSTTTTSSSLRPEPMLLMEFHGSAAGVAEQAQTVQERGARARRRRFPVGHHPGGAQQAVGGAPPRLLCRHVVQPRLPHRHHRHLRADQPPGHLHQPGGGRGRRSRPAVLHRRPCGRRQLPHRLHDRPGAAGAARHRRAAERTSWCSMRCAWKAPAPASMASACTSRASCWTRPVRPRWR